MITAIIIDDEADSRENLCSLLKAHCPQVEILKTCHSPKEGLKILEESQPSLVFLDIEMPGMTGFELLEKLNPVPFEVIFTTAFNQYAIRAIKLSALDYLLKPIIAEDLKNAVSKFERRKTGNEHLEQMRLLLSNLRHPKNEVHKIAIPSFDGMIFINITDIIRLEAEGSYTRFHTRQGQYLVSRTMKEYEDLLSENDFFRVHHGHMINLNQVNRYVKGDGGYIILHDGTNVPVSARRKTEVLERISRF